VVLLGLYRQEIFLLLTFRKVLLVAETASLDGIPVVFVSPRDDNSPYVFLRRGRVIDIE
jgi:hypothetical protein